MLTRSQLTLLALIVCASVSSIHCQSGPVQHCAVPTTTTTRVSVDSRRNQTGHWITMVRWEEGGMLSASSKTDPWAVGVEHSTTTCERDETIHMLTITTAPTRAIAVFPPGYEWFPGEQYYKFHETAEKWPRARQICTQEGAHLAIINSENEANVIKQLFSRFPVIKDPATYKDYAWVGLYEQGANGQYFTIFGAPLNTTGFTRWTGSLVAGTDQCVLVQRDTGALTDGHCHYTAPFVCERQA